MINIREIYWLDAKLTSPAALDLLVDETVEYAECLSKIKKAEAAGETQCVLVSNQLKPLSVNVQHILLDDGFDLL